MLDWNSNSSEILLNPTMPEALRSRLSKVPSFFSDLKSSVFLTTSGSTSSQLKLVALSKESVLNSAGSVNEWVRSNSEDVWFQALPHFHIGGLAVYARAHLSRANVVELQMPKWDAELFVRSMDGCTLGSLVPTQVFDLVEKRLSPAKSLRAVFVGGGALAEDLYLSARDLGWPLLPTYGCSEACSQVATASLNSLQNREFPKMEVLPHLDVKVVEGLLALKGSSLFSGYVFDDGVEFSFQELQGWFHSEDRVELNGRSLFCLGRASSVVKVNGENVDLDALNFRLRQCMAKVEFSSDAIVVAESHPRSQNELLLVSNSDQVDELIHLFNSEVLPFERLKKHRVVHAELRTSLGKPRYSILQL